MERQEQIQEKKVIEEQDEDKQLEEDMKEMVKDLKDMRQRINHDTYHVQEQDKRLVGVNDKLDDYNKKVKKGDKYMDVVNRSPFGYLKDKFFGLFKSKKEKKLDNKDKEILEKARNKNNEVKEKNDEDWTIKKRENNDAYNEDEIIDEALKEAKGMRKDVKKFTSAVIDSNQVVDVTNKNMDISLENVDNVNKKMKKHK